MTWNDLVRVYFPNATNEECEYILWNRTAFPCSCDKDLIEKQLIEYKNKINNNKGD